MRLVERMTQHPPVCLHCGAGNAAPEEEMPRRAVDLEREVNWGDSTYICEDCGGLIAALLDFISPGEAQNLQQMLAARNKQIHELRAQLSEKSRRMEAIVAGKRALKEERASA